MVGCCVRVLLCTSFAAYVTKKLMEMGVMGCCVRVLLCTSFAAYVTKKLTELGVIGQVAQ